MNTIPQNPRSGYPFGFPERDYRSELRFRDTHDLQAEVTAAISQLEHFQYLALEVAEIGDGSRDYIEFQLPVMMDELERRQQLLKARRDDPLRPRWPTRDDSIPPRVKAVKAAWPIERFCRELLRCDLTFMGSGRWKTRCPLPSHPDRTPSFVLYVASDSAYCFGCHRGGDVIKLSQYMLNRPRFIDALVALERESGRR